MTQITQHGQLGKDEHGYRIVFERVFRHPVAKVWDALINPEKLAVWFMKTELDPVPGGRMTMHFGDDGEPTEEGKALQKHYAAAWNEISSEISAKYLAEISKL